MAKANCSLKATDCHLHQLVNLFFEQGEFVFHRLRGVNQDVDLLFQDRPKHLPAPLLEPVDP